MASLNWPDEAAAMPGSGATRFAQPGSNLCLDFHGDPLRAQLVVFSDGNHHMALRDVLTAFLADNSAAEDIFYSTTPPRVALEWLRTGQIDIGNLRLSLKPHVFISPPPVLAQAVAEKHMTDFHPFMHSQGTALLVKRGNPKNIHRASDLLRPNVRLFLSNPLTEKISYDIYRNALRHLAGAEKLALDFLDHAPEPPDPAKLVYGQAIHHREAPQALADGQADVAVVFHHLAVRYRRIFPNLFEFVRPAAWVQDHDEMVGRCDYGLVGDGGKWGGQLVDFLETDAVTKIYQGHGLERVLLR